MADATPEIRAREESLADKLRRNPALLVVAGILCGVGAVLLLTAPLLRVDPSENQVVELPMPEGAAAKLPHDEPERQSLIAAVAPNLVPSWLRGDTPGRTSIAEVVVRRARKALGLPPPPRARAAEGAADARPAPERKTLRVVSAPATQASTSASYSASAQRPPVAGVVTAFPEGAPRLAGPAARGSDSSMLVRTGARTPSTGAARHGPVEPAAPVSSAAGAQDHKSTALAERRAGEATRLAAVPDAVADGRVPQGPSTGPSRAGEAGTGAHDVNEDLKPITPTGNETDRGRFASSLFNNLPAWAKTQWQAKFDELCTRASGTPVCDPVKVCIRAGLYAECLASCRMSAECGSFNAFPPTPTLTIEGCPLRKPAPRTLRVVDAPPGKSVTVECIGPKGERCGNVNAQLVSGSGSWSETATSATSTVGLWKAWVVIDGKRSSNVECRVDPPLPPP